mmetsp:Transcript_18529/g.45913  ORF Transcript_18529/g.45913 Transcript_18529/m.45913 type:complete len:204 (-) Transcript_18529:63-674(-)
MSIMMKLTFAILTLSPIASASSTSNTLQLSLSSQAVLCCEQKGGIHKSVDLGSIFGQETKLCDYDGKLYKEDFFLNTFCGGSASPIAVAYPLCSLVDGASTATSTCLDCCLDIYKDYRDKTCGNSDACQQINGVSYLNCENDCVRTCQDVCKAQDEACVAGCSSNLRGAAATNSTECTATCNNDYFTCNNNCNEERMQSRENA